MKALSLKQPWLQLIIEGTKTIETRTWSTRYRGPLLLCASLKDDPAGPWDRLCAMIAATREGKAGAYLPLPRGEAAAAALLVDCRPMTKDDEPRALCRCEPGRFAWILRDAWRVGPFPVKGKLGLFDVELPR